MKSKENFDFFLPTNTKVLQRHVCERRTYLANREYKQTS